MKCNYRKNSLSAGQLRVRILRFPNNEWTIECDTNGTENYTDFLTRYCDYWAKVDPAVDQSDTAAPGLITYATYKRRGNEEYKRLTDKVIDYIKGAVPHLTTQDG